MNTLRPACGPNYDQAIEQLVLAGLRGQLQTGSLLTGQLYVELGFHPDAAPAAMTEQDGIKVVPTVPASLEAVAGKVNGLLDTLGRLPLEEIANNVRGTVEGTNRLVNSKEVSESLTELERLLAQTNGTLAKIDRNLVPEAAATLTQTRATLSSARELVARDSAMVGETMRLLRQLSAAARSVRGLTDYLERHPEALIKGKGTR